jgi:ubiquinone/menaquinone biosynthesis C-methylase UbiE
MSNYLSYLFEDTPEFIGTFDELPLWSAPFGLLLLKHLEYKPNLRILDIGSGAGFPLTEIADRFGSSCKCYGLDIWKNANERAKQKIRNYGLENVSVIEGSAESIPFDDASIDLNVSNLGINNFSNPPLVFAECCRVLRPGGKLALTTNLNGHWKEFYSVLRTSIEEMGRTDLLEKLREHEKHRGSVESISKLFADSGFAETKHIFESFEMKFVDGSAFLNHHFVKLGWLGSWKELLAGEDMSNIFTKLEQNLNALANKENGLTLTVPMAYIEGQKP